MLKRVCSTQENSGGGGTRLLQHNGSRKIEIERSNIPPNILRKEAIVKAATQLGRHIIANEAIDSPCVELDKALREISSIDQTLVEKLTEGNIVFAAGTQRVEWKKIIYRDQIDIKVIFTSGADTAEYTIRIAGPEIYTAVGRYERGRYTPHGFGWFPKINYFAGFASNEHRVIIYDLERVLAAALEIAEVAHNAQATDSLRAILDLAVLREMVIKTILGKT